MKLIVSQTHINDGLRNSCQECAISLAAQELMNPQYKIETWYGGYEIRTVQHNVRVYEGRLSPDIINWMYAFDTDESKGKVQPTEFEISIPERYLKESR